MVKLITQFVSKDQDPVWCLAWSVHSGILASCGTDKIIRLWEFDGDKQTLTIMSSLEDAHNRTVRTVAFSLCGRYLVSTSFDSTAVVWELKGGDYEVLTTLEGHENEVKSAAFSPSGRYIASCSRDKSVWVWEMDEDDEIQCCSILNAHAQDVKQVLWKHNDDVLTSVSYDDSINFYTFDGDEWIVSQRIENAHNSTVWSASFNKDDSLLATCSDDFTVKIWSQAKSSDGNKWRCSSTLSGYHSRPIYHIDWCPLTGLIATACGDNQVRIFRQSTHDCINATSNIGELNFELVESFKAHDQDVNCVKWCPKFPGLLASCSDDGFIKLWQVHLDNLEIDMDNVG